MKKRRRAYKKWDWKRNRANEILSQPWNPFAELYNWYAETFKVLNNAATAFYSEIAKLQEEIRDDDEEMD